MSSKIVMSGMRPTSGAHLGHWEGVLKNWLELQESYTCYFSVADWHALATEYQNSETIHATIRHLVLDWLSVGIDPEYCTIYRQSQVKEVAELYLLLSMITPLGLLDDMPTFQEYLAQMRDRELNTFGLLGYPLLMAVDILAVKASIVPVGRDQLPHLDLTREVARRFNAFFGDYFPEPMHYLATHPSLPGIDGRRMSKSGNNAIYLSDPPEVIEKKIKPMATNPRRRKNEGEQEGDCAVYALHLAISGDAEKKEMEAACRQTGFNCSECKKILVRSIHQLLEPIRERRARLGDDSLVEDILQEGEKRARRAAARTLEEVRSLLRL